jgi:diguanylate cyclase
VRKFKEIIPGLDSYRGRYAYLSLLASIVLMNIAFIGWSHVSRTSQSQLQAVTQRSHTTGLLVNIQLQLNALEGLLQHIVIEPNAADIESVNKLLGRLDRSLRTLAETLQHVHSGQADLASDLTNDSHLLDTEVKRLIDVRKDVDQWFPAMQLLQDGMNPHSRALLGELQSLLREMETGHSAEARLEALESITSLRRGWFAMEEEMHAFLVYRFGVLNGEPQTDQHAYQVNIHALSDSVASQLEGLGRLFAEDRYDLIGAERIDRLKAHHRAWLNACDQVFSVKGKNVWRRYLQMMHESIGPILLSMRERSSRIGLRLENDSVADIIQLTLTARLLSKSILGIALIGMLMILAAYLYINRNLLRPIAQMAHALKEAAKGVLDVSPPPAFLRETRDLVEAFSEMRSQVHQRQRYLDHIAHHDALTQLPNRILFRDRLEHALAIALRGETHVGLMFLDLDEFKQINDSLGHFIGDELLKVVAERLTSLVRHSDTVARLGGDEFAILIEGVTSREDVSLLAKKILRVVAKPMMLSGKELRISVSIGIATAPYDDVSAEYLIRSADAAMYEAKRQGGAAYHFFSGELTSRAAEILQLENQVRQGVEQGEFVFHFQPVVDSRNGQPFCFEALIRWQHSTRGMLQPDAFLSVLDDTGLIITVIDPLLQQAAAFQREQHLQYGDKIGIALNLSARLLNDETFRQYLLDQMIARLFLPGSLILEITEDVLMQELVEADLFLRQAQNLGARIALDDFGTGQASLSHLRQFPFDFLKIDREFIRNVDADTNDASLILAMVRLAHAFGIKVIAEGVESKSQLEFLQRLECDYIQGYLISAPRHAEHTFDLDLLRPLFER